MRNYTTQMDAARKGIVTPEIEKVAEKEHMSTEALRLQQVSVQPFQILSAVTEVMYREHL